MIWSNREAILMMKAAKCLSVSEKEKAINTIRGMDAEDKKEDRGIFAQCIQERCNSSKREIHR